MRGYFRRLSKHPGVPIASFFSVLGFVTGLQHGDLGLAVIHCLVMSIFWVPVFLTVPKNTGGGEG
jgi:hypothetical protein